jgi:hypothetical protein
VNFNQKDYPHDSDTFKVIVEKGGEELTLWFVSRFALVQYVGIYENASETTLSLVDFDRYTTPFITTRKYSHVSPRDMEKFLNEYHGLDDLKWQIECNNAKV